MLLSEVKTVFQDDHYLYEIKFAGIRAFIYVSNKNFVIMSRQGINLTDYYPELREIQKIVLDHKVIFDGEIIATDNGVPLFSLLQKRAKTKRISDELILEIPVSFVAFDIIYDNKDLTNFPLIERKKMLEKYKDTDYFIKSKVYHDGKSLFKMVKKMGLEGIVAKKKASKYYPGARVPSWIKVKNIKVDNFLIHGYLEKTNTYSLFLGEYKNNQLYYVGKVSVNKKHEIINILRRMKKSDNQFVNCDEEAIYVEPIREVRVRFLQLTKSGMLRHAVIVE